MSQSHPLTDLLLIDVPDERRQQFPAAVRSLEKCSCSMSDTGVSNKLAESIKCSMAKHRELQREFALKRVFLALLKNSCMDLKYGHDQNVSTEIQGLADYILYCKADKELLGLTGIPAKSLFPVPQLCPHTLHVLQLVMGENAKKWIESYAANPASIASVQAQVREKLIRTFDSLNHCDKILSKRTEDAVSSSKKELDSFKQKIQNLVASHNLAYYTLKKNEAEICKLILGPCGTENMPLVVAKLKQELDERSQKNQEKKNKLEIFEGLGSDFKRIAEKYAETEKKIKYTKMTLKQLESMHM